MQTGLEDVHHRPAPEPQQMLEASIVATDKLSPSALLETGRRLRDTSPPTKRRLHAALTIWPTPKTIKARVKDSAKANPDRALANRQAYYEANKAKIKQRVSEWNAANPEATRSRGRNYRARARSAEGSHTGEDIKALFKKQKGKCIYCPAKLGDSYHVDHIKALARGGSNWPSNLQLTCGPCNNRKRAIDPIEFARRNGRLI